MLADLLADYVDIDSDALRTLTSATPDEVYTTPLYLQMLADIDVVELGHTMVSSRHYLDEHLPPIVLHYQEKFALEEFPLSGYMVVNWVMAYLKSSHMLPQLLETHTSVSRDLMVDALPDILTILGEVPEAGEIWQKAFATVIIPMIASYE